MTNLENELLIALKLAHAMLRGRHCGLDAKGFAGAWEQYRTHSPEIRLIEATIAKSDPAFNAPPPTAIKDTKVDQTIQRDLAEPGDETLKIFNGVGEHVGTVPRHKSPTRDGGPSPRLLTNPPFSFGSAGGTNAGDQ